MVFTSKVLGSVDCMCCWSYFDLCQITLWKFCQSVLRKQFYSYSNVNQIVCGQDLCVYLRFKWAEKLCSLDDREFWLGMGIIHVCSTFNCNIFSFTFLQPIHSNSFLEYCKKFPSVDYLYCAWRILTNYFI